MRDIDAIKPLDVQYFCTGTTPGHGDMMVRAVEVPVSVGGMTVMPGDMVHMDLHGVVKFPAEYREEVLIRARKLLENEAGSAVFFNDPDFSLEKWKKSS
jgi:regulator of RNase E activity RraA